MKISDKIKYDNINPIKYFSIKSRLIDLNDDKKIIQNDQVSEIVKLGKKRLTSLSLIILFLMIFGIYKSFTYSTKNYLFTVIPENKTKFSRGMILDRNNNIISASIPSKDLYLKPSKIINKKKLKEKINFIIPNIKIVTLEKIIKNGKYRLIKKHISKTEESEILKMGEPALIFQNNEKRVYPQNNLFSQITGFVSKHNVAKSKLELSQNKILEGGKDVKLTVDLKLQTIFYEELSKGLDIFNAKAAAALMMDVNTGEILTMMSIPDYNPNFPSRISPYSEINLITSARYEMGSTLKTFNIAMALENNLGIKKEFFDVSNPYELTENYLVNDIIKLVEPASLNDIFINSSNIGSIKIFDKVGVSKQKKFFSKIKIDRDLKIDGLKIIKNKLPINWNQLSGKSLSFGYGASLTPISLVSAYATLVNGGYYIKPKIIKDLEIDRQKILSNNLSNEIRELLNDVVLYGSGKRANVKGIEIGGKTGTARKTNNKNYNDKVITSFVGIFPINKPKFIMFILFDEPKHEANLNYYGGNTAAPIFSNILRRIAVDIKIYPNNKIRNLKITKNKTQRDETF